MASFVRYTYRIAVHMIQYITAWGREFGDVRRGYGPWVLALHVFDPVSTAPGFRLRQVRYARLIKGPPYMCPGLNCPSRSLDGTRSFIKCDVGRVRMDMVLVVVE